MKIGKITWDKSTVRGTPISPGKLTQEMLRLRQPGEWYTDAEIIALKTACFEEAKTYYESVVRELEKVKKQLELAESLIPLDRHHTYEWLSAAPSYGGSDPD